MKIGHHYLAEKFAGVGKNTSMENAGYDLVASDLQRYIDNQPGSLPSRNSQLEDLLPIMEAVLNEDNNANSE